MKLLFFCFFCLFVFCFVFVFFCFFVFLFVFFFTKRSGAVVLSPDSENFEGLKNEFELAMVNELLVFELLRFNCIAFSLACN